MPKNSPLQIAYNRAWKARSIYIRKKENGICYTCGAHYWNMDLGENDWSQMQAGHFWHGVLDFDDVNIHCQCVKCNKYLSGNASAYATRLVHDYGAEEFLELEKRKNLAKGGEVRTVEDYIAIENKYLKLTQELTG